MLAMARKSAWQKKHLAKLPDGRFLPYHEYIKSKEWRAVRKRYKDSKLPWECAVCGDTGALDLHHRTYKNLGHERLMDLLPLCKLHHQAVHDVLSEEKALESRYSPNLWEITKKVVKAERKKLGRHSSTKSTTGGCKALGLAPGTVFHSKSRRGS